MPKVKDLNKKNTIENDDEFLICDHSDDGESKLIKKTELLGPITDSISENSGKIATNETNINIHTNSINSNISDISSNRTKANNNATEINRGYHTYSEYTTVASSSSWNTLDGLAEVGFPTSVGTIEYQWSSSMLFVRYRHLTNTNYYLSADCIWFNSSSATISLKTGGVDCCVTEMFDAGNLMVLCGNVNNYDYRSINMFLQRQSNTNFHAFGLNVRKLSPSQFIISLKRI